MIQMIQNIINEMLVGNFSFLILIVGILQLIVMIRSQSRKREGKKMTPQVYENLQELSYEELLHALDNVREHLYEIGEDAEDLDYRYYIALMQELDKRQRPD